MNVELSSGVAYRLLIKISKALRQTVFDFTFFKDLLFFFFSTWFILRNVECHFFKVNIALNKRVSKDNNLWRNQPCGEKY